MSRNQREGKYAGWKGRHLRASPTRRRMPLGYPFGRLYISGRYAGKIYDVEVKINGIVAKSFGGSK